MFGERLAKLRNTSGLSQQELATRLDIAKSTLAMYETNKRQPDFDTLGKIADYFDVSYDYLLGKSDHKHKLNANEEQLIEDLKTNSFEEIVKNRPLTFDNKEMSDNEKISLLGFIKALRDLREENS